MYDGVKAKLLQYIELQEQLYTRGKCGLSWVLLREKALFCAAELGSGMISKHRMVGCTVP
jgi:hypothetical protein